MDPQSGGKGAPVICREADDCDDLDLKLSRAWLRIGIAGVFAGQGMVFSLALNMTPPPYASAAYWLLHGGLILSALVVMAFLGGPLFASTWTMLRLRRLSIEGLFTLSLLGAFTGSVVGSVTGQGSVFYEVVAIVVAIYTFGRMLGERSQAKLKLESGRLRERFDRAVAAEDSGEWVDRRVAELQAGAKIKVEPGGAFSVDGRILEGVGYVQETALTGEPLPVVRRPGDRVRAGTWSVDSRFILEAEHTLGARELDSILSAVEQADGRPSELQTQANGLIRIFLPLVVLVSAGTALGWAWWGTWVDAVLNSMAVLLVACPCALGLATPVAISQGLFRLARLGLASRDGALLDALARTRHVFFDKTGTLSESSLRVTELWLADDLPIKRESLLAAVREAEMSVAHPVARAIAQFLTANEPGDTVEIRNLRLLSGLGIAFDYIDSKGSYALKVGEAALGDSTDATTQATKQLYEMEGKRLFVWLEDELLACFVLKERLREGVDSLWQQLSDLKIKASVLTGDPLPHLIIPDQVLIEAGLSSAGKVRRVVEAQRAGDAPIFVGDGINDAAAMRAASASVAMGSGTGLARSSASGHLTGDRIEVLPQAITLARDIQLRLRGNLMYAAAYNVVGMVLAAAGILHPVVAAVIMLLSSFWVTIRALGSRHPTVNQ
jgi:heavy metal translocating P-type ATPase